MGSEADDRATARARALVGKIIDGRYQVDRILAMGGMGTVYLARHLKLKKRVALKALHPDVEDHPELILRFEREALAGGHVSHPNVACATDFGDLEDGTRYLVTEYVKGETLRATIDREAPFEPTRAVLIARQIAVALAEIHARGIVHRDLKPRNVMLAEGDFVKVVDFGLAKIDGARLSALPTDEAEEDSRLTARGVIFGTVEYLAPEAAFGMELVDARADLYALGVMLYEMLAGKHPFEAKTEADLFAKQRLAQPPPIHVRNPEITVAKALEEVVQKLLRKDFDERYQNANEVIAALDRADPEGSVAPPEPEEPSLSVQIDEAPISTIESPEPAPESKAAPVEEVAAGRLAVVPTPRRERWRTLVAAFIGGTVLALGLVYLGVRHDLESGAGPTAAPPGSAIVDEAPSENVASIPPNASSAVPSDTAPAAPVATASAALPPGPSADELAATLHAAVDKPDLAAAAEATKNLVQAAPDSLRDAARAKDVAAVLRRLAEKPNDRSDDTWSAVALASTGPDFLYRFIELGPSKASTRAHALLEKDDVRKLASPALVIAFTLHEAPCNEKLAVIERAVKEGDERSLVGLDIVAKGCVKDPHSLDQPIRELKERLRKEQQRGG